MLSNGNLLNETLKSLKPGDTFFVPNATFNLIGGIMASNLANVTIQIDGTLKFR